jgi:flagellar hook-associated protein 3 FlgL
MGAVSARITNSMVQRNILADLNAVSSKLSRTQMRAASGKQIDRPSDDPFGTAQAMALRGDLEATRQQQRNAQDARGWQDATEQALSSMTESVQRARDLITQGASDSSDQTSRDAIAGELEQILESLKQDANTTYRGSYVFAGAKTSTAPYALGASDAYQGDMAGLDPAVPGIVREIGPGVSTSINIVGREVLGDGQGSDTKLLATLRNAIDHLRTGDGNSLRTGDLTELDSNLDTLLAVRARNGARSNRVDSALDRLGQVEQSTVDQLSEVEDADMAQTMIDLSSQSAAYQAALRSGASIVQSSLLDFLN